MQIKLPITGLGMVTALGHDVVHAAAAHRAGLSLSRALPDITVEAPYEGDEPEEADVYAHRIRPLTDGFLQTGLWIRMGVAAVRNLGGYSALPPGDDAPFWSRTALFVIVPDVTSDRLGWPDTQAEKMISERYVAGLLALLGLPASFLPAQIFSGHAGAAGAVCAAKALFARGSTDRAVVLGVDSYADDLSVRMLAGEERLKTPFAPTGMIPGEAAACFLLEREQAAAHRSARTEASILAAHQAPPLGELPEAPEDRLPFFIAAGRHLGMVTAAVLAEGGITGPFGGDILADLNGEEWRAHAWAAARMQLRDHVDFDRSSVVYPCGSFGEVGAASGPVGVCLSVRSFVRGYARGDKALVLSIAEDGGVGAMLVGKG